MPRVTVTATVDGGASSQSHVDYWYDRAVGPRLLLYDTSRERTAAETRNPSWNAVLGVDSAMHAARTDARRAVDGPIGGGARSYLEHPIWDVRWADAAGRLSNLTLFNSWTTPQHYDAAGVLAGRYDEHFRQVVRARPKGQAYYWNLNHEPEFRPGLSGSVWAASIRRFVSVVAAEARALDVPPSELAVGGLVTAYVLNNRDRREEYAWWRGLPAADLPYAAFFVDTYCQHVRTAHGLDTEPLADRLRVQFGYPRAAGVHRFVVAETAIGRAVKDEDPAVAVGTDATMAAWVRRELPRCREIEGLEVLAYFHRPEGPQTGLARLEGEALLAFADECVRWNRP